MNLILICLVLLYSSFFNEIVGAKFNQRKIFFDDFIIGDDHTRVKRQQRDACSKIEEETYVKQIELPRRYPKIDRPWINYENAKLFTGENLRYNWNWMKSLKIRGIDHTLASVMFHYDRNRCLFVVWGRSVRNLLLAEQPLPIIAELSCDVKKIYRVCKNFYGRDACRYASNGTAIMLGNPSAHSNVPGEELLEPLHLYPWGTFSSKPLIEWDFTTNTLGLYDNYAGEAYLIDPSGKGYYDSCRRRIQPTTNDSLNWLIWSQELIRLLKFYEIASYNFFAINNNFEQFINEEIRRLFSPTKFQQFICEIVCEGIYSPDIPKNSNVSDRGTCIVGSERFAELREDRLIRVRNALAETFYDKTKEDGGFYATIFNSINQIKYIELQNSFPQSQFFDDKAYLNEVDDTSGDSWTTQSTAIIEFTPFIYSHKTEFMPIQYRSTPSSSNGQGAPPRKMFAESPSNPHKAMKITPPPLKPPQQTNSFEYITEEQIEEDEEKRVWEELGIPAEHPHHRKPFGIVVFEEAELQQNTYPMVTHLPNEEIIMLP